MRTEQSLNVHPPNPHFETPQALLPELEQALPSNVQLDGQLDALDEFGYLDFRLLGQRMLQRRGGISVTYMVFDLLARDGDPRRAAQKRHATVRGNLHVQHMPDVRS